MLHTRVYPESGRPAPGTRPPDGRSVDIGISADQLVKTYGRSGRNGRSVRALDGVSLTVPAGTVFGLLGPNGAGKTTTVKILTTLSAPDSGSATVAGLNVVSQAAAVRRVIGYVPQKASFDPVGTGRENLVLQGRIHGLAARDAASRADELLRRFALVDAADRRVSTWSGGMQRKLDVAMGLVHRPAVLFLDEPTTGLDPAARAQMWTQIRTLATRDGLTVLLTTHYLDEADQLATQLAIVDRGRVVAGGSPEALKNELAGDTITFEVTDQGVAGTLEQAVARLGVGELTRDGGVVRARVRNGAAALPRLLTAAENAGVDLQAVTVARPSLDDVYLHHTGRTFAAAASQSAKQSDNHWDNHSANRSADQTATQTEVAG